MTAPWSNADPVHDDLRTAKALVYDPAGLVCTRPRPEPESAGYCAHTFAVDGRAVRFRTAKTTPTKTGQFVTLWARSAGGPIRPLDTSDAVDLVVIGDGRTGQFVFPVAALAGRGIVSTGHTGGKRGFRVYPPWAATTSRQATATQAWQLAYFLPAGDAVRARELYRAA